MELTLVLDLMVTNSELKKSEYDNLYKEILDNSSKVYQILNVCVSVTGVLLGVVFTVNRSNLPFGPAFLPFLALLPFAVVLPSIILVDSSLNATVRVAAYIMVAYEKDGSGIGWQHAVQQCRLDSGRRRFMSGLAWVFWVLTLVCFLASALAFISTIQVGGISLCLYVPLYLAVVMSLFALLFWRIRQMRRRWDKTAFEDMARTWERILQKNAGEVTASETPPPPAAEA